MVSNLRAHQINICNSNISKGLSFDGVTLAVTYMFLHVFRPFDRGVKTEFHKDE